MASKAWLHKNEADLKDVICECGFFYIHHNQWETVTTVVLNDPKEARRKLPKKQTLLGERWQPLGLQDINLFYF